MGRRGRGWSCLGVLSCRPWRELRGARPHETGTTRWVPMCSHQAWHSSCYFSLEGGHSGPWASHSPFPLCKTLERQRALPRGCRIVKPRSLCASLRAWAGSREGTLLCHQQHWDSLSSSRNPHAPWHCHKVLYSRRQGYLRALCTHTCLPVTSLGEKPALTAPGGRASLR